MNQFKIINDLVKLARFAELLEESDPKAANMIDEYIKEAASSIEDMYPPIDTPVVEYKYVPDDKAKNLDTIANEIYSSDDFKKISESLHTKEATAKLEEMIFQKLA